MAGQAPVPDDAKWRIAAAFSAKLPFLYDRAFRAALGDRYDELEQEVWIQAAQTAFDTARSLSLPVGTTRELAETMRTVLTILFGPGFKSEALEVSKDGAVIIIRRCPFIEGNYDADAGGRHLFRKCMAFTLTSVPRLNQKFSARFVRTLCTGDRQCEIKIEESKPATTAATPKK